MNQYETFRKTIVNSEHNPELPNSYMRALYDHSQDPHNRFYTNIWIREYDKLCELKKRQIKHCDTIVDLITCAILNIKKRLICSHKRDNNAGHDHLE